MTKLQKARDKEKNLKSNQKKNQHYIQVIKDEISVCFLIAANENETIFLRC
jgi:hypothetical protein